MSAEKFIAALPLQELYRDKDTGLPLSGGTLDFFEDANRLIRKPVFKYTGSPGNPSFTALPNPVLINSAGMAEDGGDPVAIYYFPFDDMDDVELYFVEIRNSATTLQNTREAWPPGFVETTTGTKVDENFIGNGQFNIFTYFQSSTKTVVTTGPTTTVTYGSWSFKTPAATTTVIDLTFDRFGIDPAPDDAPRYALNIDVVTSDPADLIRDLSVGSGPVNMFSSDTDKYTFSFWGKSNTAASVTLTVLFEKFYGTGGSPSAMTETIITTVELTPSYKEFSVSFVFGNDSGKTLGNDDNDAVTMHLRLPLGGLSSISVTDFILTPGEIANPIFPIQTYNQTSYRTLIPPIPAQDGSDLLLPLHLTFEGIEYDPSMVGIPVPSFRSATAGFLDCNGQSLFRFNHSPEGVPFQRLFDVIDNRFGTGIDFQTSYPTSTDKMNFTLNEFLGVIPPAPTDVSAGLIGVTTVHAQTISINCLVGINETGVATDFLVLVCKSYGSLSGAIFGAGTSGFTVTKIEGDNVWDPFNITNGDSRIGYIITGFAALPGAGTYFQIATNAPAASQWYVWFQVDGGGVDPAPGGTGILVNRSATDNAREFAIKLSNALNSFAEYEIKFPNAGGITQNGHWNFDTQNTNYYAWYNKDGGGTDPVIGGRVAIEVTITTGDTATQVRDATQSALNTFKFAVPDLRGQILKGFDPTGVIDPNFETGRFNPFQQLLTPKDFGTWQWPMIDAHTHDIHATGLPATRLNQRVVQAGAGDFAASADATPGWVNSTTGKTDTRPWNMAVNWVIKY